MDGLELDEIKDALIALYNEYHNPGAARASGTDIEALYTKAVKAWRRLTDKHCVISQ